MPFLPGRNSSITEYIQQDIDHLADVNHGQHGGVELGDDDALGAQFALLLARTLETVEDVFRRR